MNCQICDSTLSDADLAADPYVRVCLNCWQRWEQEAGEPMRRYGKPGGKSICTVCGMVFGGMTGFDIHRAKQRCNPPEFLIRKGLFLKDGIWRLKPSSGMAKFLSTVAISGDLP